VVQTCHEQPVIATVLMQCQIRSTDLPGLAMTLSLVPCRAHHSVISLNHPGLIYPLCLFSPCGLLQVRLLDITDVNALKDLQNYDLPKGTGPHAIVIAPGERLVALSNYYVRHNQGLGVAGPFTDLSDKSVRLFSVAADGNSFVPHPKVPVIDFKNLFPHKGTARPHGMAFKAVPVKA